MTLYNHRRVSKYLACASMGRASSSMISVLTLGSKGHVKSEPSDDFQGRRLYYSIRGKGLLSSDLVRIALDLHGAEFMVRHNLIFLAVTHGVNSERHF